MATSPIYSWPEPDNTDLVKNGALAIRTMGNAIDTTMGTMVAKTVVDAKGDLIVGTAADTVGRLAVAENGSTLVADSSTSTGLRYQSNFAAGKNKFLNSDFGIWQRGTSFNVTTTGTYTADRWLVTLNGTGATRTISQQTFTPATAPVAGYEGQYYCRFDQSVAGSGGTYNQFMQRIEDVRTLAGQTVTLSFWAKASSATSLTLCKAEQNFGSGGSATVNTTFTASQAITTSWVRYSYTVALPSLSGLTIGTSSFLNIVIGMPLNATFTIDIWGVQLEASNTATAFQTATGTLQGELAACQRYYTNFGQRQIAGVNTNSTTTILTARPPVTMRTTPTVTYPTSGIIDSYQDGGKTGGSAPGVVYVSDSLFVTASGGFTGLTVGSTSTWNSTQLFQLSAEL